jgi:hypothetical protein
MADRILAFKVVTWFTQILMLFEDLDPATDYQAVGEVA